MSRIARDVGAGACGNTVGAKSEKRARAPVASAGMVPGRAPVQEFDERPEMFGTVLARAKLSPLDPWEIDDRRAVVGDIRELDPSVDHAAQPDGGASAVIRSVVAEHQQLRGARTHGGEGLAPVPDWRPSTGWRLDAPWPRTRRTWRG